MKTIEDSLIDKDRQIKQLSNENEVLRRKLGDLKDGQDTNESHFEENKNGDSFEHHNIHRMTVDKENKDLAILTNDIKQIMLRKQLERVYKNITGESILVNENHIMKIVLSNVDHQRILEYYQYDELPKLKKLELREINEVNPIDTLKNFASSLMNHRLNELKICTNGDTNSNDLGTCSKVISTMAKTVEDTLEICRMKIKISEFKILFPMYAHCKTIKFSNCCFHDDKIDYEIDENFENLCINSIVLSECEYLSSNNPNIDCFDKIIKMISVNQSLNNSIKTIIVKDNEISVEHIQKIRVEYGVNQILVEI